MNEARLTLVSAGPSPYARKVAIALHEKGLPFSTIDDRPWDPSSITPRYSPLAQLPILLVEGEEPVYDSSYILTWLEAKYPTPPLLPVRIDDRLEAMRRQMLGERIMEIAQLLIFEYQRQHCTRSVVDRQSSKLKMGFAALDRIYLKRNEAIGPAIDLGDIAVGTTCLVIDHLTEAKIVRPETSLVWRDYCPALHDLCAQLSDRTSFRLTEPRSMNFDISSAVN